MIATAAISSRYPRIAQMLEQMAVVDLRHDAPAVADLVRSYRDRYGLGPRVLADDAEKTWEGMIYFGRAVAVFGRKWRGQGRLEITDAYCEDSRVGRAALGLGCLTYRDLWRDGKIEMLSFVVLWENVRFWKAAMTALGQPPYALTFALRRE